MGASDVERGESLMSLMDWRKAARTPPSHRIISYSSRRQGQLLIVISLFGFFGLLLFFRSSNNDHVQQVTSHNVHGDGSTHGSTSQERHVGALSTYNSTYPITKPTYIHDKVRFKIGIISDMDQMSKSKLESNTWVSYYMLGTLVWDPHAMKITVTWDKNNYKTLKSTYGHKGRGMELSELVTFDGKLLTFDDRSGLVYVIDGESSTYPWVILSDCEGKSTKGFKSEWATVKDEHLYVGSIGKEWTSSTGEFVNYCPMYVKRIHRSGAVESIDWTDNYKALRSHLGIEFPGYIIHESAVWSDVHKKWFFFPRRLSTMPYNEDQDEFQGTNVLITCDEHFKDIKVIRIGEVLETHGPSSFKFLPGTEDSIIVALRTTEVHGKTAAYIMAFTIEGKIIYGETKIGDLKYEGFEFV